MKPFTTTAIVVFSLVSLAHILRLCFGFEVLINGWQVPMWVSAMGAVATGTLAVMLWRESRRD